MSSHASVGFAHWPDRGAHHRDLHGGTVEVNSGGPGQGSEFVVTLPLLEHAAAAEIAQPATLALTPVAANSEDPG